MKRFTTNDLKRLGYTTEGKKIKTGIFEFLIDPVAKPRMTKSDRWKKRPATTKYRAFKDLLNIEANKQGFVMADQYKVSFYVPMPKSWSNKKRQQMNNQPHQQKPDIDNLTKALQDCLMDEDSSIWHVDARKYWAETGRIVIEIP